MAVSPRDVVRIAFREKNRTAVVVYGPVGPKERFVVVFGTGTARPDLEHRLVRPERRDGIALGLYKDTYFYPGNTLLLSRAELTETGKRCPPDLFLDLRAIADKWLAR